MDRHRERPFFLYLAYNAVHSPLQGADDYLRRFAHIEDTHRQIFAAMLANLDDSIGEVIDHLKRKGLDDNTLIVFLSDNGGPTKELTSSNLPLRGGKGQLYEGGIRVPFLLSFPGRAPLGSVFEQPVSSLDIAATFLAAADAEPAHQTDGVNLLPYVNGEETDRPHQTLYWRQGKRAALREGDWKLVRQGSAWELFNLATDPGETRDLAESDVARRDQLLQSWRQLDQEMVDPVWTRDRKN
ncbi:MAG: sulfatase-like hydrolase/transferase [Verrucomicrobiota bacterium]